MQTKLPKVGTTIFTTMSKLAVDYQAINLSQGFPNFPIDPLLEELLVKNVTLTKGRNQLNLEDLDAGVYYLYFELSHKMVKLVVI